MFRGENCFAVQHESFADRFFLSQLLFGETQSFRAVTRASVSGDGFVKGKHTHGFRGCVFRVLQTLFMIAGLNIVMGQLFNRTLRLISMSLQVFCDMPVQAATTNRIEHFVEHFANLVVRKAERVAGPGDDELRARGFVERVE